MNSTTKLVAACFGSFIAGALVTSATAFYLFKGVIEFTTYSEMLEDFTTSIAIVSYFEISEPQHALELAKVILESSCDAYVTGDYSEDVQRRALEFVSDAQALGYCE